MSTLFGATNAEGTSKALLFFDTHPLPTLLVNRNNLKIVVANKAAAALLRQTAQELTRHSFTDLLIPADKAKTMAVLQRSSEEAPWNTVVQVQRAPKEILTAEMHVQTLVNGGEILHQITLIDITSRYAKQEQLAATARRYKGFIDQNSEGIYCQELKAPVPVTVAVETLVEAIMESVLSECNDAMAKMYGYEFGSQMLGIKTNELIDDNDESNILYVKRFITSDFKIISAESHEKDRFGNSVYFLNNAIGIVEDGLLKRIWGSQRDITHIKQVEKKVRLLADLVEQTSDVLTAADMEFKPITWNAAAEKVYGLSAQQVIGKSIRQYIDIHYHGATRDEVRAVINAEGGWRGEMSFVRPTDQKLVTLLTGFKLMKDENDEPLGYIISGTDITERKEAEKQIRLLASLVENTSDILIAVDLRFNTISWNSAAERLSGIEESCAIGRNIGDLLQIHYNDVSEQEVIDTLKESQEWRGEVYFVRTSDRKKITLLSNLKLFKDEWGTPIGFIIACTEISERKEAELLLRESEGRFRELADSAPVGIWIVNPEDNVVYVNKYLQDYTGYTNGELLGVSWTKVIHPGDAKHVMTQYEEHFKKRMPIKLIYKLKRADGEYSWVQETGIPRFLADGTFLGYIGSVIDIDDTKKKEEQLHYQAIVLENVQDCIITMDLNFTVRSFNKTAEQWFDIARKAAIGKDCRSLIPLPNVVSMDPADVLKGFDKNGMWEGEISIKEDNDEVRHYYDRLTYLLDEEGNRSGVLFVGSDITDRKRATDALKESESRFKEMSNSAPVGIWIADSSNELTYMNHFLSEYIGAGVESNVTLTSLNTLIHPDDLQKDLDRYKESFLKRLPVTLSYRLRKHTGEYRWMQNTAIPRFLANGEFIGYLGSVVDVHDAKLKEEQLHYQAIVLENVQDCIITTDMNFVVRSFNKTAEEWFGLTREEAIGKNCKSLIISTDLTILNPEKTLTAEEIISIFDKEGVWEDEITIVQPNGEKRNYFERLAYLLDQDGNRTGILFLGRDITDRKRAEEKVLQSENFYRSLIANSLDGMLLIDPDGTIKFVFPSIYNVLGYESEDMLGRNTFEFVHPDDVAHAYHSFQETILKGAALREEDKLHVFEIKFVVIRVRKKDGSWTWCMVRGHSQLHNPHINSIVIYLHDDSLRKNAIDALQESEQRFRHMIHDLQVGVLLQDPLGNIEMANQIMLQYLNATEENEVIGQALLDMVATAVDEDENPIALADRPLARVVKTKQPVRGAVIGICPPGTTTRKWIMLDINPILNDEGKVVHIISSLIDITERKKLENKLRFEEVYHQRQLTQATIDGQEKERREIGKELHDNIGQQLTTTKLYLDMARSTADNQTEEMVSFALRSVSDVINEIRGISRSLMPPTLGDLGLIDSINDLIETLVRTQTIQIDLNDEGFYEDTLPDNQKLMVFRIIQEQLNNIVKHAHAKNVVITLASDAASIFLEITDDGVGFDLTKARKGLGLTNIRNRVELFAGKMEVITADGQGCTLKITVPLGMSNFSQFE